MKYSNYRKKPGFFAGKGFYIVLAACIVAVGVAAFSAVNTISSVEDKLTSSKKSDMVSSTADVGQTVSNVKNDKASSSKTELSSQQTESRNEPVSSAADTSSQQKEEVYFTLPIKNGSIGKLFSDSELQYSATHGDRRLHLGVDIVSDKGTEVVAATSGKVLNVTTDGLWGKMVVIDHGHGIVAYYCGLENTTVSKNDTVKAGVKIGEVGTVPCECADASHLHVAVTREGKYISPLDIIGIN